MADLNNLKKLPILGKLTPKQMQGFQNFNETAFADGAIPVKYKELIALGVALTTQCEYCLEIHKKNAIDAGATQEEMSELSFVVAAIRAGGAITHATHLVE